MNIKESIVLMIRLYGAYLIVATLTGLVAEIFQLGAFGYQWGDSDNGHFMRMFLWFFLV